MEYSSLLKFITTWHGKGFDLTAESDMAKSGESSLAKAKSEKYIKSQHNFNYNGNSRKRFHVKGLLLFLVLNSSESFQLWSRHQNIKQKQTRQVH